MIVPVSSRNVSWIQRVLYWFLMVSPCEGSLTCTQLSCQILSPQLTCSHLILAHQWRSWQRLPKVHILFLFLALLTNPWSPLLSEAQTPMSVACRLCNSAVPFGLSALVPSALVINVCLVLRKENVPVSSCVPLTQKKTLMSYSAYAPLKMF